jgi:hypothetical protein
MELLNIPDEKPYNIGEEDSARRVAIRSLERPHQVVADPRRNVSVINFGRRCRLCETFVCIVGELVPSVDSSCGVYFDLLRPVVLSGRLRRSERLRAIIRYPAPRTVCSRTEPVGCPIACRNVQM